MSTRSSCLPPPPKCKESFPAAAPHNPPSFRQQPITQPLRSKISPWKVLSVFIVAGNLNSLLSRPSTTVATIYFAVRAISKGEKIKSRCNRDKGFSILGEKVQAGSILYPNQGSGARSSLSETIFPRKAALGNRGRRLRGELWHSPLPGVGAKAQAQKVCPRSRGCVPPKGHFPPREGRRRLRLAPAGRGRCDRVNPCTLRRGFP